MYRPVDVEPLQNLDRPRIGPGEVTKTEVETPGWAAVQLLQGLVLLLVLLLVLDGEKRIVLSVLHHVVMQGLTLCNLISLVPPPVLTYIPCRWGGTDSEPTRWMDNGPVRPPLDAGILGIRRQLGMHVKRCIITFAMHILRCTITFAMHIIRCVIAYAIQHAPVIPSFGVSSFVNKCKRGHLLGLQAPVQAKDGGISLVVEEAVWVLLVLLRLYQLRPVGELLSAISTLRGGEGPCLLRLVCSENEVASGTSGVLTVSLLRCYTLLTLPPRRSVLFDQPHTHVTKLWFPGGAKDQHMPHEEKWRPPHGEWYGATACTCCTSSHLAACFMQNA